MAERQPNGCFAPGNSGNPGGRPKIVAKIRDLAREHTEAVIRTLSGIMKDEKAPTAARVTAAIALADRGWGRAPQYIDQRLHDERGSAKEHKVDLAELLAIARGYEAQAQGNATQDPDKLGSSPARAAVEEAVAEPEDPSVH